MSYRYEPDLEFLRNLKNKELDDLVEVLTKNNDGSLRVTGDLAQSENFKIFYPNHSMYIELIMAEIQEFGGNSFVNIFRGGGVYYKEILCDVCDKMKVNYNKKSQVQIIEGNLLMKIMQDSLEKMSKDELIMFTKELQLEVKELTPQAITGLLQAIFRAGGFKSYQYSLIIANAIWRFLFGKGLSFVANRTFVKLLSVLSGPIGWTITGIWTAVDISGPAYRVTIPAVIQVIYLRQLYLNKDNIENFKQND